MLDIDYDARHRTLTCSFAGDLKSSNCPEMEQQIAQALARLSGPAQPGVPAPPLTIKFDLARVQYVSSIFLRIVLMTAKRVPAGQFSVAGANAFVKDLFQTSGLDGMLADATGVIESTFQETRTFVPPASFARAAHLNTREQYEALSRAAQEDPAAFWGAQAQQRLVWDQPYTGVLEWQAPHARWFQGGRLNASVNCLDKHLDTPVADKVALIWEGEPGEVRTLTYRELHREVCRCASVLRGLGVEPGDRVIIYLPMVPEAVVSMLACARLGAVHSVVFGGFSAQAVADRIQDSGAQVVITADGGYRKGGIVPLKANVDGALALRDPAGQLLAATVRHVLVLRRTGQAVTMQPGRDVAWQAAMDQADPTCPPASMASEDLLFILYTSGSTGKPKGIMHTTAGYLLNTQLTHYYVFDLQPTDVYWCTADVGWITGHSYVVYGPLANGATVFMYEGAPMYPEPDRFWRMIARHKISIFYTAPTAIRACMQAGDEWPARHDLSSLRLLGSVGEPINPQAWMWYHEVIGRQRCPIVDTWWQTETGAIMITTLPGLMPTKPGSAGQPLFGVAADVVNDQGQPVAAGQGGKLIVRQPWPSMLRGVWGDPARFEWTYWKDLPGCYLAGDGARRDADGYFWIMGRIDDVLNVAGHRIGTAEVESALVGHPAVAEAAVVGRPDDLRGAGLVAFVSLKRGTAPGAALRSELQQRVAREMGAVARPDEVRFVEALPKTRSGKIMRRLLKQVAAGTEITGDVTTLDDWGALQRLTGGAE